MEWMLQVVDEFDDAFGVLRHGCLGLIADITGRKEAQEPAADKHLSDALTGLGSRAAMLADLESRDGDAAVLLILDIDRFKTTSPSEYFKHVLKLHEKWHFRKVRCEVSVAQKVIVTSLKEDYIRPMGLALSIDEYRPTVREGAKAERIMAI